MKKLFVFILAFALLLSLGAAASADGVDESGTEIWYGHAGGLAVTLTLGSDGGYTLDLAGESRSGSWTKEGGDIFLDGEKSASLLRVGELLVWPGLGLFLTQSEPAALYTPAEPLRGIDADFFNGYWTSAYVDADGAILPADDIGDATDLYVEAPRAALGGKLFGDVIVDMEFVDDALRFEAGEVSVVLRLQSDGILRMTLTGPDGELVIYLQPKLVEGLTEAE